MLRSCSAEACMKKHLICRSSQLLMIITVFVYIKRFHLDIFVFTFTVKRLHIYGALLHLALKVFTFTGPYYIFTFRGATYPYQVKHVNRHSLPGCSRCCALTAARSHWRELSACGGAGAAVHHRGYS